jgi:hypothetical protein
MVCPAIDNPASFEIRALIRLFRAKSMSAAEIERELRSAVYGQNALSERTT